MHVLEFLRIGPDCISAEDSFIWSEDVLCGANVCNVYRKVSEKIAAYDLLERLHGRSADDALDFTS